MVVLLGDEPRSVLILFDLMYTETARCSGNISDLDVLKSNQPSSSLTVSSNFEPRKSRSSSSFVTSTSSSMVFRPDVIFVLLRKTYKESDLGTVCRMVSRILHKLIEPVAVPETSTTASDVTSVMDETSKSELSNHVPLLDYSSLGGGRRHFTCSLCLCVTAFALHKLAESTSEFWSALPLVQALLPALRPSVSSLGDNFDDNFSPWKQTFVQQALSQIVATSSSTLYHPLLHACAGYLSSFSPSHAKAACILIDLCSSVLAPWMAQVIARVDLAVELLEDLLGTIQGARHSLDQARAALKYIVLALSGHMDDILGKYKEVKHRILFLLEMLEPFIDPAIYAPKSTIAFGDVSFPFLEKQEQNCVTALNVIRTAVQKPAVLPSLEFEWRRGSVAPSVLLSILEPHMQLPPEIDLCKSCVSKSHEHETSTASSHASLVRQGGDSSKSNNQDETIVLTNVSSGPNKHILDSNHKDANSELNHVINKKIADQLPNGLVLDCGFIAEYFNLQADYFQLINYRDCELRASEFQRLALDLHSENEIAVEGHDAAIDALLLAAEC
ncbi:hypothetical protein OIU85_004588 [Salix viminalis]|uniref:Uncharacterized protein n=1 Tax=Salix viminalis TaxID=40686 RepID=A0A9Q0PSU4_SALVM|nr:hypothetical protein OIU85_004588 [Salix viminalis]